LKYRLSCRLYIQKIHLSYHHKIFLLPAILLINISQIACLFLFNLLNKKKFNGFLLWVVKASKGKL